MAMYLGEDKVASLGSICNVSGSASKNLFDAYKYSENKTHTGNVSKYSIINPNEIEISYINGWSRLVLTLTGLEPNTDYTISAYLDKSNFSTSVGSGFFALDNYQDNAFTKGSGNVYFTFTSSSTGTFDMWFYGNWSGTDYSGSIIYQNIQLEKGSTVTEYEEYYEPIISIKDSKGAYHEVPYVVGKASKNLFNKNSVNKGYVYNGTGNLTANANWSVSSFISVNPSTQYTYQSTQVSGKTEKQTTVSYWNNGVFISENYFQTLTKTITTPSNCTHLTISYRHDTLENLQLEEGATITPYEEPFEPKLSIRTSNGTFQDIELNVDNFPKHIGNSYSESTPFTYTLDGYINLIFTYQSSHGSCGGVYVAFRGKSTGDRLVTIVASQHVKSISFSDGVLTVTPDSWGVEVVTMKIR